MVKWLWWCLSRRFLQCNQYGSKTKSRILEVINHVDQVSDCVFASLQKKIDNNRKTKITSLQCVPAVIPTSQYPSPAGGSGDVDVQRPHWHRRQPREDPGQLPAVAPHWSPEEDRTRHGPICDVSRRTSAPRYEPASRQPVWPASLLQGQRLWRRHCGTGQQVRHVHRELRRGESGRCCWLTLHLQIAASQRDASSVCLLQDHHDSPIGLASTIAHEMGHNFGLSHDEPDCVCGPSYSSKDCIMADKLRLLFQIKFFIFNQNIFY